MNSSFEFQTLTFKANLVEADRYGELQSWEASSLRRFPGEIPKIILMTKVAEK